jgi:hypothetical protein
MMRSVTDCAPSSRNAFWRARVLAFLGAALVGLVAPSGCVVVPGGGYPSRESVEGLLFGPDRDGKRVCREASCGAPSEDCEPDSALAECEPVECPPRRKPWHHLPKLHLYEPEAGIFNFCIPPQCINPPSPLPPGRFFPVPVQPAFAQREESGYGLLFGGDVSHGGDLPGAYAPCP